jgi:ADP-ribosylation factor-like protein 8
MEITLVGLQYSGKTTLLSALVGDKKGNDKDAEDMIPTVGFNMRKVTKGKVVIKAWDVGGQSRFRQMWERYCRGVSAIVFVVDAADPKNFEQARLELHDLLGKHSLGHIPLLVVGNKCDLPEVVPQEELDTVLELDKIKDRLVCSYSVSALERRNIETIMEWLLEQSKRKE